MDRVIGILEEGRRNLPTNLAVLTALGFAYQQTGNDDKAAGIWEEAARLHPYSADIMNDRAWIYATSSNEKLRNPPKGLELANLAVSRYPDNVLYMDTLARAFEANGDFAEAAKVVSRIIQLLPKDAKELEQYTKQLEELKKKSAAPEAPKAAP
jgi:cytochrome c-type biogenesis protein CcmH/NrfG